MTRILRSTARILLALALGVAAAGVATSGCASADTPPPCPTVLGWQGSC